MNVKKIKEQLANKQISVNDLTDEEIIKVKRSVKKELANKKEELNGLNKKIKAMKKVIDNLAN